MFAAPTQIPTVSEASLDPNASLAPTPTSSRHLPARCDLSDNTFSAWTRHLSRPTPTSAQLSLLQVLHQPDLCHDLTSATTWLLQRPDLCYDSTPVPTNGYPNTTSTTASRLPQPTTASAQLTPRSTSSYSRLVPDRCLDTTSHHVPTTLVPTYPHPGLCI